MSQRRAVPHRRLAIFIYIVLAILPLNALANGNPFAPLAPHIILNTPLTDKSCNPFDDAALSGGSSTTPGTPTPTTTGGASSSTCCASSMSGTTASETDLVRWLQAEALQENGGEVTGGSAGGAEGKYQYIDSTWVSSAAKFYPPASVYPDANAAPEAYQDAVAYLNFAYFFKQEDNNLFKVAVDWFYPAANSDPSLLDVDPPDNVITPRQYANAVIQKFNSNAGSSIPIKVLDAPDFAKYAQQEGVPLPGAAGGASNPGSVSTCQPASGNGAVANNIVQTALNFAWPDTDDAAHTQPGTIGSPGSEEPAYYKAWMEYDQASDTTDCSAYVATVMIASGADPDYPKVGSATQQDYVEHSSKYQIIPITSATTTADLQPGDILIQNTVGIGHTEIYVGPQSPKPGVNYSVTEASLGGHTPDGVPTPNYMLSITGAIIARYIGGSS